MIMVFIFSLALGVALVMIVGFIVEKIFGQPAGFFASAAMGIVVMSALLSEARHT
jgi:hypothetical protein